MLVLHLSRASSVPLPENVWWFSTSYQMQFKFLRPSLIWHWPTLKHFLPFFPFRIGNAWQIKLLSFPGHSTSLAQCRSPGWSPFPSFLPVQILDLFSRKTQLCRSSSRCLSWPRQLILSLLQTSHFLMFLSWLPVTSMLVLFFFFTSEIVSS